MKGFKWIYTVMILIEIYLYSKGTFDLVEFIIGVSLVGGIFNIISTEYSHYTIMRTIESLDKDLKMLLVGQYLTMGDTIKEKIDNMKSPDE